MLGGGGELQCGKTREDECRLGTFVATRDVYMLHETQTTLDEVTAAPHTMACKSVALSVVIQNRKPGEVVPIQLA